MSNNSHLLKLQETFAKAMCPEDVFGGSADMVASSYKDMAKLCHPDRNREHPDKASEVFQSLGEWLAKAEARINDGTYGLRKKIAKMTVAWKGGTLGLFSLIRRTQDFSYYDGEDGNGVPVTVKVSTPKTRNLVEKEFKILSDLDKAYPYDHKVWQPFPRPLGVFKMDIGKGIHVPALITTKPQAAVKSMEDIRKTYSQGIDPRDAAWIINRLSSLVERCNNVGVAHCGLLPTTIDISAEHHTIFVQDWHTVTKDSGLGDGHTTGDMWECFIPPEVKKKEALGPCTDLFSIGAIGGWLTSDFVPYRVGPPPIPGTHVPRQLRGLLKTCCFPSSKTRPYDNAAQFHEEWKAALLDLYGPPVFRPFTF